MSLSPERDAEVKMQSGSSRKTVVLTGSFAIDRASELASRLLEALSHSPLVDLDLSAVFELDLSALQVLYAAAKSARSNGGELRCIGTVSDTVCSRLVAAGFSIHGPLSGDEFMKNLPEFGKVST
jgi:anti-anti-sigma regulatory factor